MPTILTHAAVPLAIRLGLGRAVISTRLTACGAIASMLPDLDVLAFHYGIPYAAAFGHRGFSHSLLFAALLALLGASLYRWLQITFARAYGFLFIAIASHGMLDAFTNGGLGIAFFWPVSMQRYFAPVQVIDVSPIGVSRIFSMHGLAVIQSELLWVWLPSMSMALCLLGWRYLRKQMAVLNNVTDRTSA